VIRRSARGQRIDAFESEVAQIELLDVGLDHGRRIVLSDVVARALGQRRELGSVIA